MIRVLIADDEKLARTGLRSLLARETDVEIVGECGSGQETAQMVETLKPDALFLDVQMPALTGLEMLRKNGFSKRPYTIIVSAYDDYALEAYDARVMDYVLKPVDGARLQQALIRLRGSLNLERRADGLVGMEELLRGLKVPQAGPTVEAATVSDRVPVKIGRRVRFLSLEHIRHLIADGSYVNLHMTTGEVIHTSERISQMESKLTAHHFVRIHRSVILNIDQIRDVRAAGSRYAFTMLDGSTMTSGVTYKMNIQTLLARWKKNGAGSASPPA